MQIGVYSFLARGRQLYHSLMASYAMPHGMVPCKEQCIHGFNGQEETNKTGTIQKEIRSKLPMMASLRIMQSRTILNLKNDIVDQMLHVIQVSDAHPYGKGTLELGLLS